MNRTEFLAEAARRGYPREWLFLLPGPDAQRNPEGGGVVVEAPSSRTGGRWHAYVDDRGPRHEGYFAEESAAYRHLLDTVLPDRATAAPTLTREEFLTEVERRGGRASWFVFRPGPDETRDTAGRVVIERRPDGWAVYRGDDGPAGAAQFGSEGAALQHVLGALLGHAR